MVTYRFLISVRYKNAFDLSKSLSEKKHETKVLCGCKIILKKKAISDWCAFIELVTVRNGKYTVRKNISDYKSF